MVDSATSLQGGSVAEPGGRILAQRRGGLFHAWDRPRITPEIRICHLIPLRIYQQHRPPTDIGFQRTHPSCFQQAQRGSCMFVWMQSVTWDTMHIPPPSRWCVIVASWPGWGSRSHTPAHPPPDDITCKWAQHRHAKNWQECHAHAGYQGESAGVAS